MNEIETMPSDPILISRGDTQLVKMPEGLPELVNYLDGPAAPSISAQASIAEPARCCERDFVDDHHKLLLFAGVTTLLLLIFRVHN